MTTTHNLHFSDSRNLSNIDDNSIDLVVTSPPYPMIEMWDDLFIGLNPEINDALIDLNGDLSFDLMHNELDKVWQELDRVIKIGGLACINIGDATRTIGNNFNLYPNHSRITASMTSLSFSSLPLILWRKPTNLPTKFMGSGMLPSGAYVTLEHEYILVFRKGGKRLFSTQDQKRNRSESAFFWEERNQWFSDNWNFVGINQSLKKANLRERSAAYPFELSYRLINMFSVKGDLVLDPFLGTGTTLFSAMACERNSIGIEYDGNFENPIHSQLKTIKSAINQRLIQRVEDHDAFVKKCQSIKKNLKYKNHYHCFPVMTRQEQNMILRHIEAVQIDKNNSVRVDYATFELDDKYPETEEFIKNKTAILDMQQLSLF